MSDIPDPLIYRVSETRRGHDRGWSYTPVRGKAPFIKEWQSAPREPREQAETWARNGNLALRTGEASGIVVIDDDSEDGSAAARLDLPTTVTVITGGGRRHYYFRRPEGGLGCSSRGLPDKIDVRCDGGAVVAPGSIHPETGAMYRWAPGLSPDDVDLAELPRPILNLLRSEAAAPNAGDGQRSAAGWAGVCAATKRFLDAGAPVGHRNQELFAAACDLNGCGIDLDEAEPRLLEGASRCVPPMEVDEVRKTIASAYRLPRQAARTTTKGNWSALHDMSAENGLTVEFAPPTGTGKSGCITARFDGDQHTDRLDILDAQARQRLVDTLKKKWPGFPDDEELVEQIECRLDELAAEEARRRTDRAKPAESASSAPFGGGDTYVERDGCFVWLKPTPNGVVPVQLTNFKARIVGEVRRDDGVEAHLFFEITAEFEGRKKTFMIPAAQFAPMNWVAEHLGPNAVVFPGMTIRDHARAAIQLLHRTENRRNIYTHVGWVDIDGKPVFLHAAGAIGHDHVEVDVEPPLDRFVLPQPVDPSQVIESVRDVLKLLEVAPHRVTAPLLCATFLSVLGVQVDFSPWLYGRTGTQKSELASLFQRFFGAGMDRTSLPCSWSSTANSNEAVAFHAKDVLLVVDDFAPQSGNTDKLNREAERLVRAQGNRSGRGRCRQDGSLRPVRPPRGILLSTGEDLPRGESVRARIFVVEVRKGDVDLRVLTECQACAAGGAYSQVMANFVSWLRPRRPEIQAEANVFVREFRRISGVEGHDRLPDQMGLLLFGARKFLDFAVEAGALDRAESEAWFGKIHQALFDVAQEQVDHQRTEEPADRFLSHLRDMLTSGLVHLAHRQEGQTPPARWGWRRGEPCGTQIGWWDGQDVYLNPTVVFAEMQKLARASGSEFPVTLETLLRRLDEKQHLKSVEVDGGKRRFRVRRMIRGTRLKVLHFDADLILPPGEVVHVDQVDHAPPGGASAGVSGPPLWPTDEADPGEVDQEVGQSDEAGACAEGS